MAFVTAELAGQQFRVSCAEGEEDRLRTLLDYYKSKLDQVKATEDNIESDQAFLLAGILLTDELFTLHQQYSDE